MLIGVCKSDPEMSEHDYQSLNLAGHKLLSQCRRGDNVYENE